MTDRPTVLHPHDAASAPFDFLAWRITRRFVVDRLRALGGVRPEATDLADRVETETMDEASVETLQRMLVALGEKEVLSNDELFLALERVTEAHGLAVDTLWHLPAIRPDWSEIPMARALFVGDVDGVRVGARPEPATTPVPPYVLVWTGRDGRESAPEDVGAAMGEYLPFAPGVWDWLLARRLTLLCAAGRMSWPSEAPLAVPAVSVPPRGF